MLPTDKEFYLSSALPLGERAAMVSKHEAMVAQLIIADYVCVGPTVQGSVHKERVIFGPAAKQCTSLSLQQLKIYASFNNM